MFTAEHTEERPLLGILFDLDGTLLDIDLRGFLEAYYGALVPVITSESPHLSAEEAIHGLDEGVRAMMFQHPDRTNAYVFAERFAELTGIDLREDSSPFDRFYEEVFPGLRDTAGPMAGARECVEHAMEIGLRVAVATNPIFPEAAIRHRLEWAGLADMDIQVVTTYEEMHATKPHAEYFRQTAAMLDLEPRECLMVGDDRTLDMAAADVGMRTYYVGADRDAVADFRGDLGELRSLLDRLVDA